MATATLPVHKVTFIQAFATSLAVCRDQLQWYSKPVVYDPELGNTTWKKIQDRAFLLNPTLPVGGKSVDFVKFGYAKPLYQSRKNGLYVGFPRMHSNMIKSKLAKWTDGIVLPAFREHLPTETVRRLPHSYEPISHRLIPICQWEMLRSEWLGKIWESMVATTKQCDFGEFKDMFLLVTFIPESDIQPANVVEDAWRLAKADLDGELDIRHIENGDLDVHIETHVSVRLPS
ncbi:MAG: hypothetical protein Q9202_005033 [Teloschistes flavicans]